ncbi:MAG: ADP-forming succinate--CoA ligase subunit beta [Myxococcales bacterium]|nr:ADP-forming succinate--CoA ligase subunit beta [Myxococcales bacterium]
MKIHEYQGKQLFRNYNIPVPAGEVAGNADEAAAIAEKLGGTVVVKAQIHAGGRGKGHLTTNEDIRGVKVVKDAASAKTHAEALLGQPLRTHQTGADGQKVKKVLVEEASDIASELYVGMVLDRETSQVTFMVSTEGGMDIEEVAANQPEKIIRQGIDPATGISGFHARKLAYGLGMEGTTAKQASKIFIQLYKLFVEKDASLVEINPLIITGSGDVMAIDAKLNFDANALYKHPDIVELRDADEEDEKERIANDAGLNYVSLDGNIGCLVNGAGLAMATMDIIKHVGAAPANFLDVGGGATAEQVTQAFKIILSDPNVKAILVNIFGGIAKCDVIADGVVVAAKEVGLDIPLVVRLEGTNVEAGKEILYGSGLEIIPADDMLDAANKVVASLGGAA